MKMASSNLLRKLPFQVAKTSTRCFCGPANRWQNRQADRGKPIPYKRTKTNAQPQEDDFMGDVIGECENDPKFLKSKEGITADFQRVVRIYRPVKNAGQQYNQDAYGTWQVEFVNAARPWNNPLMGWTSRKDSMYDEHFKFVHFDSKDDAIKWAIRAGYRYEISEPKVARKKPKSYNSTFGLNGIPSARPDIDTKLASQKLRVRSRRAIIPPLV